MSSQTGIAQQDSVAGYQIPIIDNWPAQGFSDNEGYFVDNFEQAAYTYRNWGAKDFDPMNIFRPNVYGFTHYHSLSGYLGFLRGQLPDSQYNSNIAIDPFCLARLPINAGSTLASNILFSKRMNLAAEAQLWYWYDDFVGFEEPGLVIDNFYDVGEGGNNLLRFFNYQAGAESIWSKYPIEWGFFDDRIDESGNVLNNVSYVGKVLAFPFTEWPSTLLENYNNDGTIIPFSGAANELRYSRLLTLNNTKPTGAPDNINVPESDYTNFPYKSLLVAFDNAICIDPDNPAGYSSMSGSPGVDFGYGPLHLCNEDSRQLCLSTLGDTVYSAVSGWNDMLYEEHRNVLHPSWPWGFGLTDFGGITVLEPPIYSNIQFGRFLPYNSVIQQSLYATFNYEVNAYPSVLGSFIGDNPPGKYYANTNVFSSLIPSSEPLSLWSGIPIPALDPTISFQINHLNLKPTDFILDQGWQDGTLQAGSSGGLTYDLIHQLNTVPTFFYNIFAKQAFDSGLIHVTPMTTFGSGLTGQAISGEMWYPYGEFIQANLFFGCTAPKDVVIDIDLNAETQVFPGYLPILIQTGFPQNEEDILIPLPMLIDGDYSAIPIAQISVNHFDQNGNAWRADSQWITNSPKIFPPGGVIDGIPSLGGNGGVVLPFSTSLSFSKDSIFFGGFDRDFVPITGWPPPGGIGNLTQSGSPLVDVFDNWLAGVWISGTPDEPNFSLQYSGSGDGPFFHGIFNVDQSTNFLAANEFDNPNTNFNISLLSVRTVWFIQPPQNWNFVNTPNLKYFFGQISLEGLPLPPDWNITSVGFPMVPPSDPLLIDGSINIDGVEIPLRNDLEPFDLPNTYISGLNFAGNNIMMQGNFYVF